MPVAAPDTFFTVQDETLVVASRDGVVTNDSHPDNLPLSVTGFDAESTEGGAVAIAADGGLSYTPAAGFWGPDNFEYTVEDDSGEAETATVTVFVAPRQIPLAQVAAGAGGFALNGAVADLVNDTPGGASVSGAGDVNGDGLDDIVIAAPNANASGRSYVVFGKADGTTVELNALGPGGFVLDGDAQFGGTGSSVGGAGDVDGDGLKADGEAVELSALGSGGFVLSGEAAGSFSGSSVGGAGDVNGDGLDDIIVGNSTYPPNDDNPGRSYVVFGVPTQ